MIDRFGNEIKKSESGDVDIVAVRAEIQFLWKGYEKDPTDTKAKMLALKGTQLASNLSKSTILDADIALLENLIDAMITHCPRTKEPTISWYTAWICMILYGNEELVLGKRFSRMDYLALCIRFFERYVEIYPTNQGRTMLVGNYTAMASHLLEEADSEKNQQALAILEKGIACEEKIDPDHSRQDRFEICSTMYAIHSELCLDLGKKEVSYRSALKAFYLAKKNVEQSDVWINYKKLANRCYECVTHPLYDRAADPINLSEVVAMLDERYAKIRWMPIPDSLKKLRKMLADAQ